MSKLLKSKPLVFILVLAFATSVASCGSSEVAVDDGIERYSDEPVVEDLAIRESNCSAIEEWDKYYFSAAWEKDTKEFNTYDNYKYEEEKIWAKLQKGDPSYDAILRLRELSYAGSYFSPPAFGAFITPENQAEYHFPTSDNPYTDEEQWGFIDEAVRFCPQLDRNRLAETYSAALTL